LVRFGSVQRPARFGPVRAGAWFGSDQFHSVPFGSVQAVWFGSCSNYNLGYIKLAIRGWSYVTGIVPLLMSIHSSVKINISEHDACRSEFNSSET